MRRPVFSAALVVLFVPLLPWVERASAEDPRQLAVSADDSAAGGPPGRNRRSARPHSDRAQSGATGDVANEAGTLFSLGTARLIRAAGFSPEKVLEHYDLAPGESCRTFRKWSSLVVRRRRWREAIRTLSRTHPDALYGWLTGVRRPPASVRRAVLQQRNCLIDDLFRRAASVDSDLRIEVELGDELVRSPDRIRRLTERYVQGGEIRRRMRRGLTESRYRSAQTQAKIWRRKVAFRGTHFNRITEEAARKCALPEGAAWKPEVDRHKRCWTRVLQPVERERAILSASAAPGLSRHHWGTEIDVFGLAPHHFRRGRRRWDEYEWMSHHALAYGFFQSYGEGSDTYVEERWHWSYYPVAHALTEFASNHRGEIETRLERLWTRLEQRYNREEVATPVTFEYVREKWERYMFDVTVPPVGGTPHSRRPSIPD